MNRILVPRLNANDDEVEVLTRVVESGASVTAGQHIGDLGTTKTAVQIEAPAAGFLHWRHNVGAMVRVGDELAVVTDTALAPDPMPDSGPASLSKASAASSAPVAPESSTTRRLIKKGRAAAAPRAGVERVELARVKRDEVQILTRTAAIPTSSVTLVAADRIEPATLGPLLVATAAALRRHPLINAYFDEGALWKHTAVDLGVAMDLGRGLRVVRLAHADAATADELDARLRDAGARYLDDALTAEDLLPPSFTVTDLRMFGVARFEPLLGDRQGAILGVSGGAIAGTPLTLTLVFDHRVAAGRDAAAFLYDVLDALPRAVGPIEGAGATLPSPDHCDRCWIAVADYYRGNPRDALLTLYVRGDGSIGGMCHVCASGLS